MGVQNESNLSVQMGLQRIHFEAPFAQLFVFHGTQQQQLPVDMHRASASLKIDLA